MERLGKEHPGASASACAFPEVRYASLDLSEALPSLDALPLGSFGEPAPFDWTVFILQTGLHTVSASSPSAALSLNLSRASPKIYGRRTSWELDGVLPPRASLAPTSPATGSRPIAPVMRSSTVLPTPSLG